MWTSCDHRMCVHKVLGNLPDHNELKGRLLRSGLTKTYSSITPDSGTGGDMANAPVNIRDTNLVLSKDFDISRATRFGPPYSPFPPLSVNNCKTRIGARAVFGVTCAPPCDVECNANKTYFYLLIIRGWIDNCDNLTREERMRLFSN